MKIRTTLTAIVTLLFLSSMAQVTQDQNIPMLGEPAPTFTSKTTEGMLNFPQDYLGKWKILFSHPADFTPVCSTEILELAEMQDEFEELNTKLVVLSTDGLNSHLDWIRSLEGIQVADGKKAGINFPLVPDPGLKISGKYGMIHSHMSTTKTVRGVFIIDPENRIAAMFFYPFTTGRNFDEIKRTIIALQESDRKNVLTPANWQPGDDYLIDSPESADVAKKLSEKNKSSIYSKEWYLWYRKNK